VRGCVRLVAVVWCWLVRRPLPTHKRFLCPWVLLVAPPPTLSWWLTWRSVVVMTRAEAFSIIISICGDPRALHCVVPTSASKSPPETAFGFCCCTAAGLPVTRCDRGPMTLPIVL